MRRLEHLPVAVDLPDGVLADEVVAFVETEGGWQVVRRDGPLTPVLVIAAAPLAGTPCVVVADGRPGQDVVRAALSAGALDVVAWPDDRGRLLEAPLRIRPEAGAVRRAAVLRVAGAAGGTGTSTVALALGGLLAWSGRRVVVVGDDDLLRLAGLGAWAGPGARELAALSAADAAAELDVLARAVPGAHGLRVLGRGGDAGAVDVDGGGWGCDAVVVDGRTWSEHAHLVVARPDVALRSVRPGTRVLVNGDGPLAPNSVRRLLAGTPAARLPASARVARAGLAGRVPSGLPGTWLRTLRAALSA